RRGSCGFPSFLPREQERERGGGDQEGQVDPEGHDRRGDKGGAGGRAAQRAVEDRADQGDAGGDGELLRRGQDAGRGPGPGGVNVAEHAAHQRRDGQALADADERGRDRGVPAGQVTAVEGTDEGEDDRADGGDG